MTRITSSWNDTPKPDILQTDPFRMKLNLSWLFAVLAEPDTKYKQKQKNQNIQQFYKCRINSYSNKFHFISKKYNINAMYFYTMFPKKKKKMSKA